MTKILVSLLLTTICAVSNAQFKSTKDPFIVKSLKAEAFQKIDAQTSHGSIDVSAVAAAATRIEVFIHANSGNMVELSKDEIQKRLDDNYTLEVSVSGGVLTAIAKQKRDNIDWRKGLSISFAIYVPQNVASRLRTSHGNVTLSGLTGDQDFATSHGNLSLEKLTGKLDGQTSHGNISISGSSNEMNLSTSHGNVDANNCEGTIKLVTSNGDVQLTSLKGKVKANTSHGNVGGNLIDGELAAFTSHGNVNLENLSCSVESSTSHGDINIAMNQLTGTLSLGNSHGNISLQLPKGKGVDLDLRGKNIRLEKLENFSGSKEEHSMKGSLNGGGVAIKAETSKGTVSLVFR